MALNFPAETFSEAVDLAIDGANKLHDFVNGDINTTINTEGGVVPSVAKALNEAAAYKTAIAWVNGETQTDLLQPRDFNGVTYVPRTIPVTLGPSPTTGTSGDWRLFSLASPDTITTTSNNSQSVTAHTHSIDLSPIDSASFIGFDNTSTGLVATNLQQGIDEVAPALQASGTFYNNVGSNLVATEVEGALNELSGRTQLATDSSAGIVEKATTAEAEAGTAGKFPDAAGVKSSIVNEFSNKDLSTSGWQVLPGGMIIQWVYIAPDTRTTNDTLNIVLPLSFPNQQLGGVISVTGVTAGQSGSWSLYYTPTGVGGGTVLFENSAPITITVGGFIIAIGF